jgi:hypothetical protein
MSRLVALAVLGCGLCLGCASSAPAPTAASPGPARVTVDAGPAAASPCARLRQRILHSRVEVQAEAHTFLDAPLHMVESRRLRALQARARALGCGLPRG